MERLSVASDIAEPAGLVAPERARIAREVAAYALGNPWRWRWWVALAASLSLVGLLAICIGLLFYEGVGLWGNNIPVTWALDIVGYDWWIGIASGALLTSASLLLLRVAWRSALNRMAETVALLAAAAAAMYPILHLGRPWFFYWNLPYPNTLLLWPQFRSPLFWDAVDILAFLVVSFGLWYVGMLPDLATLRDQAIERIPFREGPGTLRAQLYGIAALGWRGSAVHWERWSEAYRTLALLGAVLVVSLQTGAAVMFAGTVEPGWHDTLLPVSFVAAATLAGVAVIAVCAVLLRSVFALHDLVTSTHFDLLGWLLLALGWINIYCYAAELFFARLGGDPFQAQVLAQRLGGPHAWATWGMLGCALAPVQAFWVPALRRSAWALGGAGLLVAFGTWCDHFMVIVTTLQRDFLPSADRLYVIGVWGIATFLGTGGLFAALLLLAARVLPVISLVETGRVLMAESPRGV